MNFDRAEIYTRSSDGELWQGEIISDLVEVRWTSDDGATFRVHPLAIVLSADCDLTQDHACRSTDGAKGKPLPNVLLCDVFIADELRADGKQTGDLNNRAHWDNVLSNSSERYQYLAEVPAEKNAQGLAFGPMAIDFKRYFCVSSEHFAHQIGNKAKRCCRLSAPFAQHLAQRFYAFQARIGLPVDHYLRASQQG